MVLAAARELVGAHGGQCKDFVNDIIGDASGGTFHLGGGYHSDYLGAGAQPIRPSCAAPGDVIQLNGASLDRFYPGMHSAIVTKVNDAHTFEVIDSNFGWDEKVLVHRWNPAAQARRWGLTVRVWRLPGLSACSPRYQRSSWPPHCCSCATQLVQSPNSRPQRPQVHSSW
jgi:hypothetical protein